MPDLPLAPAPGRMNVDFEERVDFDRLRRYRLDRARQAHGRVRPRRAAVVRHQQHQVRDRRRDRRVDQGQAVPVRAVHPDRRAGRCGTSARPPCTTGCTARGSSRRTASPPTRTDARRRRARRRPDRQAGRRDQGPPGAAPASTTSPSASTSPRPPCFFELQTRRHRRPRRPAGDAGRPADQVAGRDRAAVHRGRHGRRHVRRHRRGAQAREYGRTRSSRWRTSACTRWARTTSSRSTRSPASGATRTRTTSPTA